MGLIHRAPIDPGPAPSSYDPTPIPSVSTAPPVLPDADIDFNIATETYPSAWAALGLEPVEVLTEDSDWARGSSVWFTTTRDDGSVRFGTRAAGGEETLLKDWLSTDQGPWWVPIVASGDWLMFTDDSGSRSDGPTMAPGILLLNTTTGSTDVVTTRSHQVPQGSCLDCGDSEFVTQAP